MTDAAPEVDGDVAMIAGNAAEGLVRSAVVSMGGSANGAKLAVIVPTFNEQQHVWRVIPDELHLHSVQLSSLPRMEEVAVMALDRSAELYMIVPTFKESGNIEDVIRIRSSYYNAHRHKLRVPNVGSGKDPLTFCIWFILAATQ